MLTHRNLEMLKRRTGLSRFPIPNDRKAL